MGSCLVVFATGYFGRRCGMNEALESMRARPHRLPVSLFELCKKSRTAVFLVG